MEGAGGDVFLTGTPPAFWTHGGGALWCGRASGTPGDDGGKSRPPGGAALCGAGEDDGGATSRMGAAMGTADAVAVSAAPSTAADAVGSGADAGSAADSSACCLASASIQGSVSSASLTSASTAGSEEPTVTGGGGGGPGSAAVAKDRGAGGGDAAPNKPPPSWRGSCDWPRSGWPCHPLTQPGKRAAKRSGSEGLLNPAAPCRTSTVVMVRLTIGFPSDVGCTAIMRFSKFPSAAAAAPASAGICSQGPS